MRGARVPRLIVIAIIVLLTQYVGDFRCVHGIHQLLDLVVAHIDSMQRICGENKADHQITNPALQRAPPVIRLKSVEIKTGSGRTRRPRETGAQVSYAIGGALEPSNERREKGWHCTWAVGARRDLTCANVKKIRNGATIAHCVCAPAGLSARDSTNAMQRKTISRRDVGVIFTASLTKPSFCAIR
jgi:hypothetical protein